MQISDQDVQKIAALARLRLEGVDLAKYKQEITEIVSYVDQLSEVDTSGTEPMDHVAGEVDLRPDEATTEHSIEARDQNLAGAPDTKDGYIVVPGVFNE